MDTKGAILKKYTKERCPRCHSTKLIIAGDCSWPSLVCADCGKFVRNFGD